MKENKVENMLQEAKEELHKRRRTGRTTDMLRSVVQDALKAESGGYYLVVGHTPGWNKDMMEMTIGILRETNCTASVSPGTAIKLPNNATILFRTEEWWDQPRNKLAVKPKSVRFDNVFGDMYMEDRIRFLENELNP